VRESGVELKTEYRPQVFIGIYEWKIRKFISVNFQEFQIILCNILSLLCQ
jgi:hypothetical protein